MRKWIWRVFVFAGFVSLCGVLHAGDWPQWRGPSRDGVALESPALVEGFGEDGPVKLWTSEAIPGEKAGGYGCVSVAGGRAYVLVNRNYHHPVPERRIDKSRLARQGYRADMPAEFSKLVEAARVSEARLKVRQRNAVRRWGTAWLKANVKPEWQKFRQAGLDRLVAGRNALSLEVLAKLDSVKDKTFADQAELDAWFKSNGIDEASAKRITGRRGLIVSTTPRGADAVYCLNAESGETLWKRDLPGYYLDWPCSSTPTVSGGRVYVLNSESKVCCLAVEDGKLLWQSAFLGRAGHRHNRSSSVLLVAGKAVVSTEAGLACLSAESGEVLWRQARVRSEASSAVAWESDGKTRLLCSGSSKVTCVDVKTGEPEWWVRSRSESTPVVTGGWLVYAGGSGTGQAGCKLGSGKPAEVWKVPLKDAFSSPVVHEGYVYVMGERGRLLCIELAGGKVAWEERLSPGVGDHSSPVVADGKLIIVAGPMLYLVKATPERFTLLGRARVGATKWTSPAVADGRVFLRTNGAVVCYDLRKK